jgi:integrative and conjugative element protein (TIGR02256 family)
VFGLRWLVKGQLYRRQDSGTIYFSGAVLSQLQSHRQLKTKSKEAGGVLLGRHLLGTLDIIVDEITQPVRSDRRSWSGFFRSLAHHTRAVTRWRESGGTCAYLGSWHTHPEDVPNPSSTDLEDWRHALDRDRYEGDSLFFVIVGTERARVWQGRRSGTITELTLGSEV